MKIADVGQAKAEIDITGTLAGTPVYMAPEVFHSRVYGTKADIYSLGLIMWEMWYGQRAFADAPVTTIQDLIDWVDRGKRPV
ncbi:MAG: protein kinase, partial [Phycisphaerales bacterium]|nr:protein kinase [Phycisphaerales bacterium]